MAWAPDYCSTTELAQFVRIGDSADDTQLGLAIAAASRAIDEHTRRQFGVVDTAVARYYTPRQDAADRWVVDVDDLQDDTGLAVAVDSDGTGTYTTVADGFTLTPRNAVADGAPWSRLEFTDTETTVADIREGVRVTALWGWTEIPDAVKQACLLQASRVFARRNSPYGIAGSPDAGNEVRLLARVDPDVAVTLAPFRRKRRVVFA